MYTQEELKRYIDNFYNLSEEELLRVKDIVIEIVNKKISLLSLEEAELLSRYAVKFICELFGYEVCEVRFEPFDTSDKAYGTYIPVDGKRGIVIDENAIKDGFFSGDMEEGYPYYGGKANDILHIIFLSLHECQHYFQKCDSSKKVLTNNLVYWFNRKEITEDEYKERYDFIGAENSANELGWLATFLFIGDHKKIEKEENNATLCNMAYQNYHAAITHIIMTKLSISDSSDVEQLLGIIQNVIAIFGDEWKNNFFEEDDPLSILIADDGNLKSTQELVDIFNDKVRELYDARNQGNLESNEDKNADILSAYEKIIGYALLNESNSDKIVNKAIVVDQLLIGEKNKIMKLMNGSSLISISPQNKEEFVLALVAVLERFLNFLNMYENDGKKLDDKIIHEILVAFDNEYFLTYFSNTEGFDMLNDTLEELRSRVDDKIVKLA